MAAFAFGAFLILSLLSVAVLLVALGPNLNLGRTNTFESRLFFLPMAQHTRDAWIKKHWRVGSPTRLEMIDNYVRDAHNLAVRTSFKYLRTREAGTLFRLAVVALACCMALVVAAPPESLASTRISFEWEGSVAAWVIAFTLGAFGFVFAYDDLRWHQTPALFKSQGRGAFIRRCIRYAFPLCLPVLIITLVIPPPKPYAVSLYAFTTLTLSVAVLLLLVLAPGGWEFRQAFHRRWWRWPMGAAVAVAGVLGIVKASWLTQPDRDLTRLALAIALVVVLEIPRLFGSVAEIELVKRIVKDDLT